jgi:hypothetical protein
MIENIRSSGLPNARPRTTGNALDLTTDPSLPKRRDQIRIVSDRPLALADRKLYNVLLAFSWDQLGDPTAPIMFRAPTADLRRAIGAVGDHGNARLRQSLERLKHTDVEFDYQSSIDGTVKGGNGTLISFYGLPKGEGVVEWEYATKLREKLADPKSWARIHLAVCAQFTSKYALCVYELVSLRANMRTPEWEVDIEELRALLNVGSKFTNWAHFERRVLAPAVKEVNELSGLDVEYKERRSKGKGRRVEGVLFEITKRSGLDLALAARAAEALRDAVRRGTSPARDADTLDLADGKTDRERGSSVPNDAAHALAARIPAKVFQTMRTEHPGIDIYGTLTEWAEWAISRGEPCRNPTAAFKAFVRGKARSPATPAVPQLPAPKLPAKQRRALEWLQRQSFAVRKEWVARATAKGVELGKAAAAPDNLHRWIGTVAEEIIEMIG